MHAAAARHVGVCHLRFPEAHLGVRARPVRHQAFLLRAPRRGMAVRLRAAGSSPRRGTGARPPSTRGAVSGLRRVRSRARRFLRRHRAVGGGRNDRGRRRWQSALRRPSRCLHDGDRELRDGDYVRCEPRGVDPAASAQRCPGGHLPFRGAGFVHGRSSGLQRRACQRRAALRRRDRGFRGAEDRRTTLRCRGSPALRSRLARRDAQGRRLCRTHRRLPAGPGRAGIESVGVFPVLRHARGTCGRTEGHARRAGGRRAAVRL